MIEINFVVINVQLGYSDKQEILQSCTDACVFVQPVIYYVWQIAEFSKKGRIILQIFLLSNHRVIMK